LKINNRFLRDLHRLYSIENGQIKKPRAVDKVTFEDIEQKND